MPVYSSSGMPGLPCPASCVSTPQTVLCCSAQNCWHPWVMSPGEKWPICIPCLTSKPSTGTSRFEVTVGSSAPQDLAAQPGSWVLAEQKSPSKGDGRCRFGASSMETILDLKGMMDIFSFRMGKNKSLVPSVDKLLWAQTDHFWACWSLFGSFQGQFVEVSYS